MKELMGKLLLKDKNIIITGTNRGIGRAILTECAKNGANIWAHARKETAEHTSYMNELSSKYNVQIWPVYADLSNEQELKCLMKNIASRKLPLHALMNNAGMMKDAIIGMISRSMMQEVFDTNVFAVMELTQFAARIMMKQKFGSIINASSIVGVTGNRGQLVYSATKGAVIAMTKTAAKELAPYNIRVNAIAPGMIDTDMFKSIGEPYITERLNNIGMKRLGTPEDVAKVYVFLASDLSSYVTGQIIGVDGSALV